MTWTCPKCTFVNNPGATRCRMCRALLQGEDVFALWFCTSCKSQNPDRNNFCLYCRRPKHTRTEERTKWTCDDCTMVNLVTSYHCSCCASTAPSLKLSEETLKAADIKSKMIKKKKMDAIKKETTWTCDSCTFKNEHSNATCQMCSSRPPRHAFWKCHECRYFNPPMNELCGKCNLRKTEKEIGEKEQWKCTGCTFLNLIVAEKCVVCLMVRGDSREVSSWICSTCHSVHPDDMEVKCTVCAAPNTLLCDDNKEEASLTSAKLTADEGDLTTRTPDGVESQCVDPITEGNDNDCGENVTESLLEEGITTSKEMDLLGPVYCSQSDIYTRLFQDCLRRFTGRRFGAEADLWTQVESSEKMFEDHKREARQTWENILSECTIQNIPFIDPGFTPCERSLYGDKKDSIRHKQLEWNRCDNIKGAHGKAWTVVRNGFRAGDIQQGQLGDCWFLSALAVLAENPVLINNVMLTQKPNVVGAYQVRFCKNGKWQVVIVDDFFPCDDFGGLAFSKAKNNQLWIPLIEKAYAKLHGNYLAIESGLTSDAMADMTGAPCEQIDMTAQEFDSDLSWARLLSFRERHFLMGASCGNQPVRQYGLESNHCYSLLDVREAGGYQLLKLRNPWGKAGWLGNFSYNSPKWTPQLRRRLRVEEKDDGTFWIDWGSLLKFFATIDICKYNHDWNQICFEDAFVPLKIESEYAYVIRIPKNTWAFISITQKDKRGQPDDYQYTDTGCVVTKTKAQNIMDHRHHNYVASCFPGVRKTNDCEVILSDSECTYVVQPFSMLPKDKPVEIMLTFYSANMVWAQKVKSNPTCLTYGCQLALLDKEKGEHDAVQLYKTVSTYLRHRKDSIWMMIENRHPNKHFLINCLWSARGLNCSRRGSLETTDLVPPLSRQIVMVLSVEDPYKGYGWKRKHTYEWKHPSSQKVRHKPPLLKKYDIHNAFPL